MFDLDGPRAREAAKGYRILRGVDDPNEVFLEIEFDSVVDAQTARGRLITSGVLDRFSDKNLPTVVEVAETVTG
jgi:hypothetical protein